MELSTLIILIIAVLIIVYRVKTWNDVEPEIQQEPDQTPETAVSAVKEETVSDTKVVEKKRAVPKKTAEKKSEDKPKATSAAYKKTLKGDVAKNAYLAEVVENGETSLTMSFASTPKKGVTTLITIKDTNGDRAVGAIYEKSAKGVVLQKTFDVKLAANGSFKVGAQSVQVSAMKEETIMPTHLLGADETLHEMETVKITLK